MIPQLEKINDVYAVSSRTIAEQLGKQHSKVIRTLEEILAKPNMASLIIPTNYKDRQSKSRKEYLLTKDGFTLYMFNIQGYQDFKMAYIQKFNEMEKLVNSNQLTFNNTKFLPEKNFNDKYWDCVKENIQEAQELENKIEKIYKEDLLPIYQNIVDLVESKKTMLSAFNCMKYGNSKGMLK